MLERAFQVFKQTKGARPSSSSIATSAGAHPPSRTATPPTANRWAIRKSKARKKPTASPPIPSSASPDGVVDHFKNGIGKRGGELRGAWMKKFDEYKAKFAKEADQLYKMQHRELPDGWDKDIPVFPADAKGMAGRDASAKCLNAIAKMSPGSSAAQPTLPLHQDPASTFDGAGDFGPPSVTPQTGGTDSHGQAHATEVFSYAGRNFHFGIRELAMGAIVSGMSLSKVRAFGRWLLRLQRLWPPAIRLSAIMKSQPSTSSPTTPSASAKTAPPTNPSNTSPACARSRA